ncbi:iron ABC transporter permease [Bacillus hominis]|uniref:FecCD family ABC transporter permease n=1 Tax=Bacillus hominis TaxID=2817478 RepID=UPI0025A03A0F|nr:iron ABC transporter permease [Bacillus hominis]MDM5436372.1 iron ABC transporter permease [Bacillus hominis]
MKHNYNQVEDLSSQNRIYRKYRLFLLLCISIVFMIIGTIWSLTYGAVNISYRTIIEAMFFFDPSNDQHLLIREIRLPRALAGGIIGGFLAVAGAIMQGVTRNPLASPNILGVSDGAAFTIALTLAFMPNTSYIGLIIVSFIGAGLAVFVIFGIGAFMKGLTPIQFVLLGTAVAMFFKSLSIGIAHMFNVQQAMSFWFVGGLVGVKWNSLLLLSAIGLTAFVVAMLLSRQITALNLSEENAISLGLNVWKIKICSMLIVLVLTGSAVAIAGNIGFISLVIPHISRFLIGYDYMKVIPVSAVIGGTIAVIGGTGK